ncbi:hypothetical protein LT493_10860 [Streptomyces tricolor]|nr:hypothetical protein [Streptomyces tricolor]
MSRSENLGTKKKSRCSPALRRWRAAGPSPGVHPERLCVEPAEGRDAVGRELGPPARGQPRPPATTRKFIAGPEGEAGRAVGGSGLANRERSV